MNDQRKTKNELIAELEALRRQVDEGNSRIERERAVEHIRAEVASMRSGDDLIKVAALMRREMVGLGMDTHIASIGFVDEKTHMWRWYNVINGFRQYGMHPVDPLPSGVSIVGEDHVRVTNWIEDADKMPIWRSGQPRTHTRRFVNEHWLRNHWGFCELTEECLGLVRSHDVQYNTDVPFEHGLVAFAVLEQKAEHVEIVRELTEALSLGYLRYLDFQQLEQQAEQARRERAVERVRAEAMAMRGSEDLLKVVAVLSQEMNNLGIDTPQTAIVLINEDRDQRINYFATDNPDKIGLSWSSSSWVEYDKNTIVMAGAQSSLKLQDDVGKKLYECWQSGDVHVDERTIEKSRIVESLSKGLGLAKDESFTDSYWARAEGKLIVNIPFESGMISFFGKGRNEDQEAMIQELAQALSLGYLRFLDFQQLEQQAESLQEQAEQARRERAVERVRAEAMAMRGSDDLLKVVAVMFQEMLNQGLVTPRCHISFIDESTDKIVGYYAANNISKYGISWQSPRLVAVNEDVVVEIKERTLSRWNPHLLSGWKTNKVWSEKIDVSQDSFMGYLEEIGGTNPKSFDTFTGEWVVTNVPFRYGIVGFRERTFEKDHIGIVQEFTEALSLGYIRFLDFQKVDEAQRQLIDELEEELQTAHTLQMGLMPIEPPQIEGFDIAGHCIPANHVGGDLFQYFQQDGKLSVCMADVTGHAMEAAVPVMMFNGVLKTEMGYGLSVEQLFSKLNGTMYSSLDSRTYVCFAMGEVDVADRSLRLANSGCPYPFYYRASTGDVAELQVDAYPLGVRPETAYTTVETGLETGDYVVFCSDGIIEAGNAEEDIFGFEQTAETIRAGCAEGLSAEGLIDRLIGAVQDFAGDTPQGDDMTCVVLWVNS